MIEILSYHAHLYYDESTILEAKNIREQCGKIFDLELGRLHEKEVGPHPRWSCQISVPVSKFGEVIPWLCIHRGNVDVFVHPLTVDELWDHTQGVIWLGKSYSLKTDMFK